MFVSITVLTPIETMPVPTLITTPSASPVAALQDELERVDSKHIAPTIKDAHNAHDDALVILKPK